MEIPRTKLELWQIVRSLGIESYVIHKFAKSAKNPDGTTKDVTRRIDLVWAIQRYYIEQRYGSVGECPKHLQLILDIPPQLACRKNQLKESMWQDLWISDNYVFEEKLNGLRFLIIYFEDEGLHVYSRHIDANEMLPIEYTDKFVTNFNPAKLGFSSFMIDSELRCLNPYISTVLESRGVVTETELQAVSSLLQLNVEDSHRIQIEQDATLIPNTFDCMFLNGISLCSSPLYIRRKHLIDLVKNLQFCGMIIRLHSSFRLPPAKRYLFYERVLVADGEGLIVKRIDSPYSPDKRNGDWIKVKRSANQVLGDTISGWITGYKRGKKGGAFYNYVGSFEVSAHVFNDAGEPVVKSIAWIKAFSMQDREAMTCYDDQGEPYLNPEYMGKVLEVDGQCFSPRSKHLVHAKLVEWRDDKSHDDCTLLQSDINKQIV